jgi:transcriptional regulator with XRE-family HTH domain
MSAVSTPPRKMSWQEHEEHATLLRVMDEQRKRIAERVRRIRRDYTLTQEQAAARAGVTIRTWQRWEAGEGEPYANNLEALAREFDFAPAEFYGEVANGLEARLAAMEAQLAELLAMIRPTASDDFPGDPFGDDQDDEATVQDEPDTLTQKAAGRRRKSA